MVRAALEDAVRRLDTAGVTGAPRDARLLLEHVTGAGPGLMATDPGRRLTGGETARLEELVRRRQRREPMSHLLGRREFWSLEFSVTADTLDPRPDSETLIEAALAAVADHGARLEILDLGAGTGCLLLALLSELPAARGLGIDISEAALDVARLNAAALALAGRAEFRHGDWGAALERRFDIIVANPPYIRRGDIAGLQPEIARFEPRLALDGGPDGLDAYRILAIDIGRLLAPGGFAVIEIGEGQDIEITDIFLQLGLEIRNAKDDLNGIRRCLVAETATALTVP